MQVVLHDTTVEIEKKFRDQINKRKIALNDETKEVTTKLTNNWSSNKERNLPEAEKEDNKL